MDQIVQEKTCDFAVAGSGSGMVAAVRAAMAGKKVIVLEKTATIGGGMQFASTMRTFGSQWQKKRNLPDITASYARKMLDECYWTLDPALVENILKGTGQFFDWFCETFHIPEDTFFVGRYVFDDETGPLGPQYGTQHNGFGRMVIQKSLEKCRELGVEILTGHRVMDAEMEDGKITALIAETDHGTVRVSCRACLLSTGSWIRNPVLAEKYCPGFTSVDMGTSPHINPAYTGDGIAIAEKAGALLDYDNFCIRLMGPMFLTHNRTFSAMSISPYAISVNLSGLRYASEPLIAHMDQFNGGHVIMHQPQGKVFAIFSEQILQYALRHPEAGYTIADPIFAGKNLPDRWDEIQHDIADARQDCACYCGATLEELAHQMGVDQAGLLHTVEEYNRYCREGFDWGFYKPEHTLIPLGPGPYYGVKGFAATDGAFGGIKVNADMQAYAKNGGLVEGLYVTGDFASGRHCSLGGIKHQFINDMNWALAGSYIAGDRVVRYLNSRLD